MNHKPHPANAPGDFYVVDGCCTMCEVPLAEAAALFGIYDHAAGYPHCFVKRQPQSPAELDQMVNAIRAAELQCIRYRGSDRLVQLRLIEDGEGTICDGLPPGLQTMAARREAERQQHLQEYQKAQPDASDQPLAQPRPWWRFW